MKQAIVAASFGTTHSDAMEKNIAPVEADLRTAFALPVFRALTSEMVRAALARRGQPTDNVPDALARARQQGMRTVVVQSTHLICGEEYDKLCGQVRDAGEGLDVRIGRPLLADETDRRAVARILLDAYPLETDEALLLMGHGTRHAADSVYGQMEEQFRALDRKNVWIGTVEGSAGLDRVRVALRRSGVRRVRLAPFLLVAGEHARNDLAGDGPESWKSVLEADGFQVDCVLRGLGEIPAVRALIVEHARQAMEA